MNAADLNRRLLEQIPALRGDYEETKVTSGGEEPGAHIVYGDFLGPLLRRKLTEDAEDEDVGKAFALLEELLATEDEYATNVVVTSVLDHLGEATVHENAWNLAGPRTRRYLREWRKWRR